MRALVVDATAPGRLRIADDRPEPEPGPGDVVIQVAHVSVNFGDGLRVAGAPDGTVPGLDAAGEVVRAASDGTGPPVGTQVACFTASSWQERLAVDVDRVAVVPDGVGLADAAAVATTGTTALRVLRGGGPLRGRVVLVTGASGGVGRHAVQLAAADGAQVVAAVGSPARGEGLTALGADEVVVGTDGIAATSVRPDLVVENVGGETLVAAFARLAPGGCLQSVGWSSGRPATFPPNGTFGFGAARRLVDASFVMFDRPGVGRDLEAVLGHVRDGRLAAAVGRRDPWTDAAAALTALAGRTVAGKAVLDL